MVGDVREDPREGGRPTVELIAEAGGRATFVASDAGRADDIDRLVRRRRATGRLDVMVPNAIVAGRALEGPARDERGRLGRDMAVGLRGVFLCCKAAVAADADAGARRRRARAHRQRSRRSTAWSARPITRVRAAKGGVVNLTRQIAVDFGPRGIICNAVAPGKILTTPIDEPDTPETLAYSHARTPFPRLGRPEDVASLARLPRDDECTYMSGANVLVDGGWMAY